MITLDKPVSKEYKLCCTRQQHSKNSRRVVVAHFLQQRCSNSGRLTFDDCTAAFFLQIESDEGKEKVKTHVNALSHILYMDL
jgi:hypothetical protein